MSENNGMSVGLKALDEFRLLINNYADKWDSETVEFFRTCHDIIEEELKDYYEIKEASKYYHWKELKSDVWNVNTDRKLQLKFDAGICEIQADYRKARALDVIKRCPDLICWAIETFETYEDYIAETPPEQRYIDNENEWNLLKEVIL